MRENKLEDLIETLLEIWSTKDFREYFFEDYDLDYMPPMVTKFIKQMTVIAEAVDFSTPEIEKKKEMEDFVEENYMVVIDTLKKLGFKVTQ